MTRPQIVANGGSPGVKASVSAASTVALTLDSIVGVRSVQWIVLSTDESTTTSDYTLAQSGSIGQIATFTSLVAGTAVLVKVIVNSGLVRGVPNLDETSNTIKVFVPTNEGLEVGVAGETYESDPTFGTTGLLNAPIRLLNAFTTSLYESDLKRAKASATSNVSLSGNPSPMDGQTIATGDIVLLLGQSTTSQNGLWTVNTSGAWTRPANFTTDAAVRGCVVAVVLGSARAGFFYQNTNTSAVTVGSTALTFSRLPDRFDRADLAAASATPGNAILTRYGSASELNAAYLSSNGTNPASTGFIRAVKEVVGLAFRNGANSGNLEAVVAEAADVLRYGNALVDSIKLSVKTAGLVDFLANTVSFLRASPSGLLFGKTATMSLTQTVQLSSAGTDATIEAQAGDTGFAGASITLASGSAGSGSTPGNVVVDSKNSATSSGRVSFRGGSFGEFLGTVYDDSTSTTTIETAADTTVFDTKELAFPAANIALFASSGTYGSGTEIVHVGPASTEPTTDETNGTLLWSFDTGLFAKNSCTSTICPNLEDPVVGEVVEIEDKRARRVNTTDATTTTLYTYPIAEKTIADVEVLLIGRCHATGDVFRFRERGRLRRNAGTAAWLPATVESDTTNVLISYAIGASGNDLRIDGTGLAGQTVKWLVKIEANLLTTVDT